MPFILGFLAGEALAAALLSRLMLATIVWGGLGLGARHLALANLPPAFAPYVSVAAVLLVLVWVLYRPAGSHTKVRLLEGLAVIATAAAAWPAFRFMLGVPASGLSAAMLVGQWRSLAWIVLMFAAAAGLNAWLARSHRLLGDASVLHGRGPA